MALAKYRKAKSPMIVEVPKTPHMPQPSADRLRTLMKSSRCYLEFGSGGSTLMADDLGVPVTVSVESDANWAAAVRGALSDDRTGRWVLHCDIGPTGHWGHPLSEQQWRNWHRYPVLGWQLCQAHELRPDLVLIDGRFRVACFLATILFAQSGTRILFDDYRDRPAYFRVEKFLSPVAMHDRMAEFVVPSLSNPSEIWLALLDAVGDQD